jgi:hypothetical protein
LGISPVQEACCRCAASGASASNEKPIACIDRRGLLNSVARMRFFSVQNQPRSGIAGKPNLTCRGEARKGPGFIVTPHQLRVLLLLGIRCDQRLHQEVSLGFRWARELAYLCRDFGVLVTRRSCGFSFLIVPFLRPSFGGAHRFSLGGQAQEDHLQRQGHVQEPSLVASQLPAPIAAPPTFRVWLTASEWRGEYALCHPINLCLPRLARYHRYGPRARKLASSLM